MNLVVLKKKNISNDKLNMTLPSLLFVSDKLHEYEYEVKSDEVCRIDLISSRFYGSDSYIDYILKYNGISNPFSITEGDILKMPDVGVGLKIFKEANILLSNSNPIRDQFINNKRLTKKDSRRVEYLQRKANQKPNGPSEILPPNILCSDKSNIKINKDVITI